MNKLWSRTCVALLLFWPALAQPATFNRQRYRWADLKGRIDQRKVAFILPDGTYVKGKVLAVQTDGLRVKVTDTSNAAAHPKGEHLIPARSLSIVQVTEMGKKWRIICTTVTPFIVLGAIAGVAGGLPESGASGEGAVGAGVLASIAGGYFLGWALDRKTMEIEIIHH